MDYLEDTAYWDRKAGPQVLQQRHGVTAQSPRERLLGLPLNVGLCMQHKKYGKELYPARTALYKQQI